MNCPKCGNPMQVELEITGGCGGCEEYCYCYSQDVHAMWVCNHRGPRCYQPAISISALSDQFSIARWLTDHYKEETSANTETKRA